ncbi:ABC-F family ATP-binding cassette domain-containing protein [Camelliibacillus cellulosilyticus]|uniref:ABC-F family ATP-binding cassette domain-containing protein n=1 Tax=Camelliibacillus cellulosilyticus TaxID=2174486 RepID=A0ABV9GJ03_9BACL
MSIVNVEHLTHGFGDKTVFKEVDFRILPGEHVGLVGPNGAGKSSLIKILSGTLLPDEGKVEWHPRVKVGHLEQHQQLEPGMTIMAFLQRAFQTHYDQEKRLMALGDQMAANDGEELDRLLDEYGKLQEWLEQNDFYNIDNKIENVATGLGLADLGLSTDVSMLSGGQRTKLLLAHLLLQEPDMLLLDEPTNYLDTNHIEWLTGYLKSYPNAFLLVSHEHDFMNEVVGVIYHLEHQKLTRFVGNYRRFLEQYELRERQLMQDYERQQKEIDKLETYIAKNKARASTAKQAKSREKRLQKIDRIEKPSKLPKPRFHFPVGTTPVSVVMEAQNLSVGYDRALFPAVDLVLKRGEKVAIIGHNGVGKTTLLKTLLGEKQSLGGSVAHGDRVKPAYFEQENLMAKDETALSYIWNRYPKLKEKDVRTALARCGLTATHIRQPLASLSGGEKTKVRLCDMTLKKGNWLILDEPTNHLDVDAKNALKEALIRYDGTLLIVSHEKSFIEGWVSAVWDVEAWQQSALASGRKRNR